MSDMSHELPKAYDPIAIEGRQYARWTEANGFAAPADAEAPPFTITIPPPNVTGELHMGHALQHVIHDTLVRRKRMQGFNALCLPGTDHAGISTNIKVDQALRREGRDRWQVGRDGFVARAREWTLEYGGTILGQLRALGCSYDWSRTRFTLDEFVEEGPETAEWARGRLYGDSGYARAVLTAFVQFYEKGWIYRGERIVNWCPLCQTTLSELEMDHREVDSHLWRLRYPAADGGEGIVVATTRPETMLGDTGVAVSPRDDRYRALVGQRVLLPLLDREIPVVADPHVDPEFGTGAVKVTPAHDPNDWDIAQRHPSLLPAISVMDDSGTMTAAAGPYAGLPREEARRRVLEDLDARGLLVGKEPYVHKVGHHDKCGTVIEPLLKLQWWARCEELAAGALRAIREGRVRFVPERFRVMEEEWLENIRPWCLSRQLWWGHRIPLYYCPACDTGIERGADGQVRALADACPTASVDPPTACPRCGAGALEQDPDVLDTWFSSALWPHATLGWPQPTEDLSCFYPTDLMITGRDILYLWVARMIMTGEEFVGREPFRDVLVHATVLTEDGRRMSKSLGTGVDPLELIRLYGADATRFGLASLVSESQDIRFKMLWASGGKAAKDENDRLAKAEQIEQMRFFCNKLWNISRFVQLSLGSTPPRIQTPEELATGPCELADRWILSRFAAASAAVNEALDRYELGQAAWALYHFLWDEFADWYLELAKTRLRGENPVLVQGILQSLLESCLRLAHPFIPFITEEIWQSLPGIPDGALLMRQPYPSSFPALEDVEAERRMSDVIEVTRAIRNLKAELGVPMQAVEVALLGDSDIEIAYVEQSARARVVRSRSEGPAASATAAGVELSIAMAGVVDLEAERRKARKEMDTVVKELAGIEGKLNNSQFLARAPAEVVEKQRRILAELSDRRTTLAARLEKLA